MRCQRDRALACFLGLDMQHAARHLRRYAVAADTDRAFFDRCVIRLDAHMDAGAAAFADGNRAAFERDARDRQRLDLGGDVALNGAQIRVDMGARHRVGRNIALRRLGGRLRRLDRRLGRLLFFSGRLRRSRL